MRSQSLAQLLSILTPPKWKSGYEGRVSGETQGYMRYRYFLHCCGGSLMPLFLVSLISAYIKKASVPFFVRPVTSQISEKNNKEFVDHNFVAHFTFLEEQLASAPNGGSYLCGNELTGADIMMSFPVMLVTSAWRGVGNVNQEAFPRLFTYAELLKKSESYQRAVDKIVA